jgi:hypothetical protein
MSDPSEFFEILLADEPKSPGSLTLELDTEDAQGMFEFFLLFLTHTLAKWFGKPVDLGKLSSSTIEKLRGYFASFGIIFTIDCVDEPMVYMIDNKKYLEETQLENMKFQLANNGFLWTVSFGFLKN